MDPLVDAKEVARVLDVPVTWVWKFGREGKIPCLRAGKYMRFDLQEVVDFLRSGSREPLMKNAKHTSKLLREVI